MMKIYLSGFAFVWCLLLVAGARASGGSSLVVAILGLAIAWRIYRTNLRADAHTVEVRNVLRTHHLEWPTIDDIRVGRSTGRAGPAVVTFLLKNGEIVGADVTRGGLMSRSSQEVRADVVDRLKSLFEVARGEQGPDAV